MIGNDLAVNIGLSYSPGDQLSILGTKIENKDFFRHGAAKVKNLRLVWVDGFIYPSGSCILVTPQIGSASNRVYLTKKLFKTSKPTS